MSLAYRERVLNGLALRPRSGQVVEQVFPEEVQGAGLRLFDLVVQAALPEAPHAKARSREEKAGPHSDSSFRAFASSRESSFLQSLRQTFETLPGGETCLNNALLGHGHATVKREWEFGDWGDR